MFTSHVGCFSTNGNRTEFFLIVVVVVVDNGGLLIVVVVDNGGHVGCYVVEVG